MLVFVGMVFWHQDFSPTCIPRKASFFFPNHKYFPKLTGHVYDVIKFSLAYIFLHIHPLSLAEMLAVGNRHPTVSQDCVRHHTLTCQCVKERELLYYVWLCQEHRTWIIPKPKGDFCPFCSKVQLLISKMS